MEWLAGTLNQLEEKQPMATVVDICCGVFEALLHFDRLRPSLIHGDIHEPNIGIRSKGGGGSEAVLIDLDRVRPTPFSDEGGSYPFQESSRRGHSGPSLRPEKDREPPASVIIIITTTTSSIDGGSSSSLSPTPTSPAAAPAAPQQQIGYHVETVTKLLDGKADAAALSTTHPEWSTLPGPSAEAIGSPGPPAMTTTGTGAGHHAGQCPVSPPTQKPTPCSSLWTTQREQVDFGDFWKAQDLVLVAQDGTPIRDSEWVTPRRILWWSGCQIVTGADRATLVPLAWKETAARKAPPKVAGNIARSIGKPTLMLRILSLWRGQGAERSRINDCAVVGTNALRVRVRWRSTRMVSEWCESRYIRPQAVIPRLSSKSRPPPREQWFIFFTPHDFPPTYGREDDHRGRQQPDGHGGAGCRRGYAAGVDVIGRVAANDIRVESIAERRERS
ncbi:unnamed protein product [Vitrella brassicaformis CCMP3155]|uniref:Protein kinase domain-containing protein n=1 Tax=Vitrella brassicaformis (strain CCMP3155) TaxID=1169540 RepID=A0A0G4EDD6_VITBC|nr:unnamed protein product [Vitrella brassicaformis CCMP3155]|eukprot:CEL94008.1 unnamed protein product [Vitrella brassicaformis CCMP3155]